MKVDENSWVKLNYEIKLADGQLVERNPEDEPLEFTTGRMEVIPAIEKNVIGMENGETRSFTVPPEDGFGRRNPEAVQVIPRTDLETRVGQVEEGTVLRVQDEDGETTMLVTVSSLDDDEAVIDLNHPLAGATLDMTIEVLDVNQQA